VYADIEFQDRADAGRRLADKVAARRFPDPVVLALPRGGVPVAAEIASRIGAPLDLLLVRKIGAPTQPELAVGAVIDGEAPEIVVDESLARLVGADDAYIEAVKVRELAEIERRRAVYLGGRRPVAVAGKTAIVVDDGIATGSTMLAALAALRRRGPARTVLAVAVAPQETVAALAREVDEIICLAMPADFAAIGFYYRDFRQVGDDDVTEILARCGTGPEPPEPTP
jgi:putative phosphoribosyl transferase